VEGLNLCVNVMGGRVGSAVPYEDFTGQKSFL
jgi:hypothetical protein